MRCVDWKSTPWYLETAWNFVWYFTAASRKAMPASCPPTSFDLWSAGGKGSVKKVHSQQLEVKNSKPCAQSHMGSAQYHTLKT